MNAFKSAQTAADNGPTWAMVYAGAILILGAFALAGATPVYHPGHSVLLNAAAYIATLIVGSWMIFLAGILRLVNGISVRRDAQAQTNTYYTELANARAARERGQTKDLEAIRQGRENGKPIPAKTDAV
jgi:hypothetical protein